MPGFNITGEDGNRPAATGETVRKHRYQLTVLEPLQEILLYAYKCQRPTPEVDRIVMHLGQDEIYLPGKNRWAPIEVTFYEPIESYNLTAHYLNRWMLDAMVDLRQSRLRRAESYKRPCELQLEDGRGEPVYLYKLYDVWPSKVSPGELSYADSDLAEIAATLELSKAVEENVGSSSRSPNPASC